MALCTQNAFFLCQLGSSVVLPGLFLHVPLCDSDNTKWVSYKEREKSLKDNFFFVSCFASMLNTLDYTEAQSFKCLQLLS